MILEGKFGSIGFLYLSFETLDEVEIKQGWVILFSVGGVREIFSVKSYIFLALITTSNWKQVLLESNTLKLAKCERRQCLELNM